MTASVSKKLGNISVAVFKTSQLRYSRLHAPENMAFSVQYPDYFWTTFH